MNMADHRGASAGPGAERRGRRRRGRDGDGRQRGERRAVHGDDRRAGRLRVRRRCRSGSTTSSIASAGLVTASGAARRRGRGQPAADARHHAERRERGRRRPSVERQELLQKHRDARAAHHRSGIEHRALGAGDARPARRGLRRRDRRRARRAGARARRPSSPTSASASTGARRSARRSKRRSRTPTSRSVAVGVDAAMGTQFAGRTRGRSRRRTAARTRWRRPTSSSPPAWRSTRLLRRHRRPERVAARRGDSVADAAQRLHGAPGARRTS